MGQKSGILRSLQMSHRAVRVEVRDPPGGVGRGRLGPVVLLCHLCLPGPGLHRATHSAYGSSVPAQQRPGLATAIPPSLARTRPSQQPMSSCHRGSILDFINVSPSPGQRSGRPCPSFSACLSEPSSPTHTMWLRGDFLLRRPSRDSAKRN